MLTIFHVRNNDIKHCEYCASQNVDNFYVARILIFASFRYVNNIADYCDADTLMNVVIAIKTCYKMLTFCRVRKCYSMKFRSCLYYF